MSSICQNDPENASALIVGRTEEWAPGFLDCHRHVRHQLIYATHGVIHITTATHAWVLPPTRALWIKAGTAHSLKIKKPAEVKILYIDNKVPSLQNCLSCVVVNVTALVRELILACADLLKIPAGKNRRTGVMETAIPAAGKPRFRRLGNQCYAEV